MGVWDHACLGPCVRLCGTMVVWDALSGLRAGGFCKFWVVVEGFGGFWWVLVGFGGFARKPLCLRIWDHGSVFGVFGLGPTMKPAHGCPGPLFGTMGWDQLFGTMGVRDQPFWDPRLGPIRVGTSCMDSCLGS